MEIIKASANLTMKDKYDLTRNPETQRMSDHKGETLSLDQYMIREEVNANTGETVRIASIKSGGAIYATNSSVFVREFDSLLTMAESSGEVIHHIKVITGRSHQNREYVTCVYVD